jgi:hypothetical protein
VGTSSSRRLREWSMRRRASGGRSSASSLGLLATGPRLCAGLGGAVGRRNRSSSATRGSSGAGGACAPETDGRDEGGDGAATASGAGASSTGRSAGADPAARSGTSSGPGPSQSASAALASAVSRAAPTSGRPRLASPSGTRRRLRGRAGAHGRAPADAGADGVDHARARPPDRTAAVRADLVVERRRDGVLGCGERSITPPAARSGSRARAPGRCA